MAEKKTSKLTSFEKNRANPFMEETKTHVLVGRKQILMGNRDTDFMVNKDGETIGHSVFAKVQKIDKAQFAKIYVNNLSAWFNLSKTGIKVFAYVLQAVKPNTDYFLFDLEEAMEVSGYKSDVSIWKGMSELLRSKFIARSTKSYLYYINPTIFFNGDRISFINSFEITDKEDKKIL